MLVMIFPAHTTKLQMIDENHGELIDPHNTEVIKKLNSEYKGQIKVVLDYLLDKKRLIKFYNWKKLSSKRQSTNIYFTKFNFLFSSYEITTQYAENL